MKKYIKPKDLLVKGVKNKIHFALFYLIFGVYYTNCYAQLPQPVLLSPSLNEVLDNGAAKFGANCQIGHFPECNERIWKFKWAEVPDAVGYQLYVIGSNAIYPIEDVVVNSTEYTSRGNGYIADQNTKGWRWKVRARFLVDSKLVWGPYSEEKKFNVELMNTDCPTIFIDFTHSPQNPVVDEGIEFFVDCVAKLPTPSPILPVNRIYNWDFGDGSTGNGRLVYHVYDEPGIYNVTVSVIDETGLTDTSSHEIRVYPNPLSNPLLVSLAASPPLIEMGNTYKLEINLANTSEFERKFEYKILTTSIFNNTPSWDLKDRTSNWGECNLELDGIFRTETLAPNSEITKVCLAAKVWDWAKPWKLPNSHNEILELADDELLISFLETLPTDISTTVSFLEEYYDQSVHADKRTLFFILEGREGNQLVSQNTSVSVQPSNSKIHFYKSSILWGLESSLAWSTALVGCPSADCDMTIFAAIKATEVAKNFREAANNHRFDFTSVATPNDPIEFAPEVLQNSEMIPVLENVQLTGSSSKAILFSFSRFLGALETGNPQWAAVQRSATLKYLEIFKNTSAGIVPYLDSMIMNIPPLTSEDFNEIRSALEDGELQEIISEKIALFYDTLNIEQDLKNVVLNSGDPFLERYVHVPGLYQANSDFISQVISDFDELPAGAIMAGIDIMPDTLSAEWIGNKLECLIELPDEYSPTDIEISSLLLNGEFYADPSFSSVGDRNQNGIPDLMLKFDLDDNQSLSLGSNAFSIIGVLKDSTFLGGMDLIEFRESSITSVKTLTNKLSSSYSLSQNEPNPFSEESKFSYSIPNDTYVSIKIFNLLGKEITTIEEDYLIAGEYQAKWDGKDKNGETVPRGIYYYRLNANNFSAVKKMLFITP